MHQFTRWTDKSAFTRRHNNHHTTTVYLLRPPRSHSSQPWITARETTQNYTFIFRHPLTSKPHSFTTPPNFDFFKLYPSTLSVSYRFGDSYPVDKLLKFNDGSLLALYGGGRVQACPRYAPEELDSVAGTSPWVNLSPHFNFDDITVFHDKVYGVDTTGWFVLIHSYKTVRKFKIRRNIMTSVTHGAGWFGWRKRFAVDGANLYLVVRFEEKLFRVFLLEKRGKTPGRRFVWNRFDKFKGNKVLFMGRDHYFFRRASKKFPGREYKNCIVFSEAAFPKYGKGRWEFTQSDRQLSEDDIAVYRFGDGVFARERENSVFPKIDWSPPAWTFDVSEPDEDGGLDSGNGDKNEGEVHSNLKDTEGKDEDEQEEMETDFGSLDYDPHGMVSHSDSQDKEDVNMQCDSTSREKKDVELHVNANIEGGASLQEDVCHVSPTIYRPEFGTIVTQTPSLSSSLSATEKDISQTLRNLNGGNNGTEEGTSTKNIIDLVHRAASTSSTQVRSDFARFEEFDIRPDLVPTLQKIWQKHGNILENSAVRSDDIIARGLESLATMVRILSDNSALSLNDSQANYLVSTLSDLRYIRFKVDWLVPFVEKAEKLHKSKPLVESLNNLSQLSSQAKERRAMLLDELTKLDVEENQRKEEMAKVSKMIPFCGQVKFDELLGTGLI
ncbi:hypothetical protein KSS87_021370 [Heliosperma pusillum]|nr:hypothetical protein KSS87_021370 [Heliosperma pusillum]